MCYFIFVIFFELVTTVSLCVCEMGQLVKSLGPDFCRNFEVVISFIFCQIFFRKAAAEMDMVW